MLDFRIAGIKTVLCLGAHADDLEIGCAGTVLRIIKESPEVVIHWRVMSGSGQRRLEAERSALELLKDARASVGVEAFRESYFPAQWTEIKDVFESIKQECDPDVVFTHWLEDRHQDHRVVSDLTWNTFRDHTILEYEIPKYDGDLGNPNVYITLDEHVCRAKVAAILRHFPSQAGKHWFTEDTFLALMRLRGIECGPGARFAEAFHGRKRVL